MSLPEFCRAFVAIPKIFGFFQFFEVGDGGQAELLALAEDFFVDLGFDEVNDILVFRSGTS